MSRTKYLARPRARVRRFAWVVPLCPILLMTLMAVAPASVASAHGLPAAQEAPFTNLTALDYSNVPSFEGILVDNNQALAFVGTISWGGAYSAVDNGSDVYASQLVLVLYDLTRSNLTVPVSITYGGTTHTDTTTAVPSLADVDYVNLPTSTSWVSVTLNIGGTKQFYQAATPISLLPSSVSNVGGLDLLVLAVISEAIIAFGAAVALARFVMDRVLWAPKFSLLIWGHVILIGIVSAVILDFQFVDSVFAGWSPLVYVFAVFPMFFAFSLSLFNRAPTALLLRANAPLAGRLSYHAWTLRVGTDPKGRQVLIDPTWRGFWARMFNHHVTLVPEEAQVTQPEPFVATLIHRKILDKKDWIKRVRRPSPRKSNPLDDFDVIPASLTGRPLKKEEDRPSHLYWTPVGTPVTVEFPRLSLHREVEVPPRMSRDGETVIPAHTKTKLSWPHFTSGSMAGIKLAPIHYRSAQSVVAEWRSTEDLSAVLATTSLDLESLKSNFESRVAQEVTARFTAVEALRGRVSSDMNELEAAQEAERTRDTLVPLDDLLDRTGMMSKDVAPRDEPKGRKR